MILRIPGKIPITIYPAFWLFAALIGWINSGLSFFGILVWVGIIFVSVLFHEMGHALTATLFGLKPRIELVAMGGLTYHGGEKLPLWKQFFIVLDGPAFGLVLFFIATFILRLPAFSSGMSGAVVKTFQEVNLFWTILNLLPVMPLDGGQLLRIVLESFFGAKGLKYALIVSALLAVLLSLFFFLYQGVFIGALFFLLAYQSYDTWRRTRFISETDEGYEVKRLFESAESDLQSGKKESALETFEKIRAQTKTGMLHILSTQYAAFLKAEQGKHREAYELLLSVRSKLSDEALCLLHKVAFEVKDYSLVLEMGGRCFQLQPSAEIALRNAYASAVFSQVRPAIGWLQTAVSEGLQNIAEVVKDPIFDPIRHDPAFQTFTG